MNLTRIAKGVDADEALWVTFCQRAECSGDRAVIGGGAAAYRVARRSITRSEAFGQGGLACFEQDYPVWPEACATEGVERQDRLIPQPACAALISAA